MAPASDPAPVAWVTGASGSLGGEVARDLARRGFAVGLHAHRHPERAREVAATLDTATSVVTADLTDAAATAQAAASVEQALGPIGVLVACAGSRDDGLLIAQSPERWVDVVGVNLFGSYHACRAVLPGMLKRRSGRVVLITSPIGLQGNAGQTAYASAKAGIVGLTRSLARECGGRGVTVNAVAPGFIDSDITAGLSDEVREGLLRRIDLGRFTTAAEVVPTIAYLVDNGYVTGQVISVDGGAHL